MTLIEQMSRSIQRFKQEAQKFEKITENKNWREVEKLFWKSLQNSSPIYGADVSGSLFDDGIPWNLAQIKTLLK